MSKVKLSILRLATLTFSMAAESETSSCFGWCPRDVLSRRRCSNL